MRYPARPWTHTIASRRRDVAYQLHPFTNLGRHESEGPLVINRGKGVYVYDESGREYLEALAGLWCTALGFGEERLAEAASQQLRALPYYHQFGGKANDVAITLAERIVKLMPVPMSKVFFNNSGSEANESAVKLVWYYNNARGPAAGRRRSSRASGATTAPPWSAASLTGLAASHRDFDLPIPQVRHTDCPYFYRYGKPGETEEQFATRLAENLDAQIQREDPDTVAAFIAEPVMGAGGVIVPPATYFDKIQAVLKKHDVLLIADEVICGFGRTGKMFGTETFGMQARHHDDGQGASPRAICRSRPPSISEEIYQGLRGPERQARRVRPRLHVHRPSGRAAPSRWRCSTSSRSATCSATSGAWAPHAAGRAAQAGRPSAGRRRPRRRAGGRRRAGAGQARPRHVRPARHRRARCSCRAPRPTASSSRNLQDTVALCPPLIISEGEVEEMLRRFGKALEETTAALGRR